MGQTREADPPVTASHNLHRGDSRSVPLRKAERRKRDCRSDNFIGRFNNHLATHKGAMISLTTETKYKLMLGWLCIGMLFLVVYNAGHIPGWW